MIINLFIPYITLRNWGLDEAGVNFLWLDPGLVLNCYTSDFCKKKSKEHRPLHISIWIVNFRLLGFKRKDFIGLTFTLLNFSYWNYWYHQIMIFKTLRSGDIQQVSRQKYLVLTEFFLLINSKHPMLKAGKHIYTPIR